MRQNTVEHEYIKPLIENDLAQSINMDYCKNFNDFISIEYPWHNINLYRIDWDKIGNYQRIAWLETSEEEITEFLKKSCLHPFPYIGIIYGAREPGLLMSFDVMCKNLEAAAHTPLTLFLVGAKKNKHGIVELEHKCFVELDLTKNWLTAPINNMTLLS